MDEFLNIDRESDDEFDFPALHAKNVERKSKLPKNYPVVTSIPTHFQYPGPRKVIQKENPAPKPKVVRKKSAPKKKPDPAPKPTSPEPMLVDSPKVKKKQCHLILFL